MEANASSLQEQVNFLEDRRISIGKVYNRPKVLDSTDNYKHWSRPTWYSPPRDIQETSRIPVGFDLDVQSTTTIRSATTSSNNSAKLEADEYGWAPTEDGKFFNVYSKTYADTHPLI